LFNTEGTEERQEDTEKGRDETPRLFAVVGAGLSRGRVFIEPRKNAKIREI